MDQLHFVVFFRKIVYSLLQLRKLKYRERKIEEKLNTCRDQECLYLLSFKSSPYNSLLLPIPVCNVLHKSIILSYFYQLLPKKLILDMSFDFFSATYSIIHVFDESIFFIVFFFYYPLLNIKNTLC